MFGKNIIMKAEHDNDGNVLHVVGIFHTIQGEGPLAGEAAIFIRLTGCNLRCHYCDTDFESDTRSMTVGDMIQVVDSISHRYPLTKYVVLTGGEPMRQNIVPLIKSLVGFGFKVQIETAGTLWLPELEHYTFSPVVGSPAPVTIVCSPKTGKINATLEEYISAWKYIITDGEVGLDGLPIVSSQIKGAACEIARPITSIAPIYIQPCDAHDDKQSKANMTAVATIAQEHGYRVSLQLHKYLDVE